MPERQGDRRLRSWHSLWLPAVLIGLSLASAAPADEQGASQAIAIAKYNQLRRSRRAASATLTHAVRRVVSEYESLPEGRLGWELIEAVSWLRDSRSALAWLRGLDRSRATAIEGLRAAYFVSCFHWPPESGSASAPSKHARSLAAGHWAGHLTALLADVQSSADPDRVPFRVLMELLVVGEYRALPRDLEESLADPILAVFLETSLPSRLEQSGPARRLLGALGAFAGSFRSRGALVREGIRRLASVSPTWADRRVCDPLSSLAVVIMELSDKQLAADLARFAADAESADVAATHLTLLRSMEERVAARAMIRVLSRLPAASARAGVLREELAFALGAVGPYPTDPVEWERLWSLKFKR